MFEFKKSTSMKINVRTEQKKQISSKEKIEKACKGDDVIAFDIFYNDILVGFAMFRISEENYLFLWNYAIDSQYQNKNLGTEALRQLINSLQDKYPRIITTYKQGNSHAQHIYEKIGFIETEIIDEPNCKEVNMEFVPLG